MKNKKGFTLIELLAIIVILAIIAVITVPIILNIIENSKKGAASDSAYGFKDAVNKAYVTKLSGDSDYSIADNTYTVDDLKTQIDLSLSGKEPASNSWVRIEENDVTEGCLQYDEYKVEITDGKVTNTEKGECEEASQTSATCPGSKCVYRNSQTTYRIGDELNQSDYKTEISEFGSNFLAHILDSENKIIKNFVCVKHNDEVYCYEEGNTDEIIEKNTEILHSIYNTCNSNICYGPYISNPSYPGISLPSSMDDLENGIFTMRMEDFGSSFCCSANNNESQCSSSC